VIRGGVLEDVLGLEERPRGQFLKSLVLVSNPPYPRNLACRRRG